MPLRMLLNLVHTEQRSNTTPLMVKLRLADLEAWDHFKGCLEDGIR